MNNWAWLVGSAGRYEEAEALHREALRLRADTPGVGSEAYFDSVFEPRLGPVAHGAEP